MWERAVWSAIEIASSVDQLGWYTNWIGFRVSGIMVLMWSKSMVTATVLSHCVSKFRAFHSRSVQSAHWTLWPMSRVDLNILTSQQQSNPQANWLILASLLLPETNERIPHSDHFTRPSRAGYAVFMLTRALVTNCAAGNKFNYAFLQTFTDTGHIQWVLSIRKFLSYSALWHTQTRVLWNRSR